MTSALLPGCPMPSRNRQKSAPMCVIMSLQAVVTAGAAAELEPHRADRQIELVVRDQHLARRRPRIVLGERCGSRDRCDSCTSCGLSSTISLLGDLDARDLALELAMHAKARRPWHARAHPRTRTRVVTREHVLGPGIAETDDETKWERGHVGLVSGMAKARAAPKDGPLRTPRARRYFLPPSFFGDSFLPASSWPRRPCQLLPAPFGCIGTGAPSWHRLRVAPRPALREDPQQAHLRQALRLPRLRQPLSAPALPRHADVDRHDRLSRPCASSNSSHARGQRRSDRCRISFSAIPDTSTSMNSGRSFGRQITSTSFIRCDTMPPCVFTPSAIGFALEVQRDADADLLVLQHALQIHVQDRVASPDGAARP